MLCSRLTCASLQVAGYEALEGGSAVRLGQERAANTTNAIKQKGPGKRGREPGGTSEAEAGRPAGSAKRRPPATKISQVPHRYVRDGDAAYVVLYPVPSDPLAAAFLPILDPIRREQTSPHPAPEVPTRMAAAPTKAHFCM